MSANTYPTSTPFSSLIIGGPVVTRTSASWPSGTAAPGWRHCSMKSGDAEKPPIGGAARLADVPPDAACRTVRRRLPSIPCRRRRRRHWMRPCRRAWALGAGSRIAAAEIRHAACRLDRYENAAERLRVRSLIGRIAQVDREARASGDGRRDRHAADGRLDDVLDVSHRQAVARDRLAVGHDVDVLAPGLPLGERAAGARHLAQHALEGDADAFDLVQVLAEDLDPHRRADTGRQHVDARADRRRDRHLVAGHAERGIQVTRQLRERARLLLGPDAPQAALRPVGGASCCTSAACSASASRRAGAAR